MTNDETLSGIIALGIATVIFGAGMLMGSVLSEPDHSTVGRKQGIVFCSEKPKQCKISYDYLKLQENQK